MSKIIFYDIITSSFLIIIGIYGIYTLFEEIIYSILPIGTLLAIVLIILIYIIRIPAPSAALVEEIVGKEPHLATSSDFVIKTVAHRGAGLDAPENSLAAFKLCKDNGIDAIEFDITLTRDNIPVVFHDSSLERMADLKDIVNEVDWAKISGVDISVKHLYRDRFPKTNIPTLEQTITQLLASDQRMFIDIKDNNYKMVKVIHDLFKSHTELYSRAVVSSFFPNILYFIRKGDPKIVCSIAYRSKFFAYESYNYPEGEGLPRSKTWYIQYLNIMLDSLYSWLFSKLIHYIVGLSIILLHKDSISSKTVIDWRKRGIRVMAWTVNSPAEKQYLAKTLKITYLTDTFTGEASTHNVTT